MGLFTELTRRKVFKVGAAYLVVAWLAVQAASIGFPAFDAPPWALRVFILVALLGFPVALVFAWAFDITPDGVHHEAGARGGKALFAMAAALIALAFAWYFKGQPSYRAATRPPSQAAADVNGAPASASALAVSTLPVSNKSIAVLPFTDLSPGHDQDYFSDGMAEEILNALAQVKDLKVAGRTSSFYFKGKNEDLRSIGKALGVAHILEGSVRKQGDKVRITAQLIEVADDSHLWSHAYDGDLSDVFQLQEDIARAITEQLKAVLIGEQKTRLVPVATSNADAHAHYLLGIQILRQSNFAAYQRAAAAFEQAIALDPNYAAAWAGLGEAQIAVAVFAATMPLRAAGEQQGLASMEKAIAIAPDLPYAYNARGNYRYFIAWDWKGAQADFEHALALDPNDSYALDSYTRVLLTRQQLQPAEVMIRKAIAIDPLSMQSWMAYGTTLSSQGHIAEARAALQRALDIAPQANWPRFILGVLDLREGNAEAALVRFRSAGVGFSQAGVAMAEHTLQHPHESQQALDELKVKYAAGFAYQIAQVYAWRGKKDLAFEWLDRAYEQHDAGLPRLRGDVLFGTLKDDPRYAALLQKLGLPQ